MMRCGNLVLGVVVCLLAPAGSALALWPPPAEISPTSNEVLVRLRPDAARSVTTVGARFAAFGARDARPLVPAADHAFRDVYVLTLDPAAKPATALGSLAQDPEVLYAEPNSLLYVCETVPNDPYFATSGSWGQSYADQWPLAKIGLRPVGTGVSGWDFERADDGTFLVAVIDTGLDAAHPDLAGRVWNNTDEIAANGIDDDGNGYVDDTWGWDFSYDDNDPRDGHGHGTHCAGTIAAAVHNATGIAGIAWDVRAMAIKGLNDGGSGSISQLAAAVLYAADNGARVLNNSYGGTGYSQTMADAVVYAASRGCLFVAAAGNSDADVEFFSYFPAYYPEALAVAATDWRDRKASFSNFGAAVELAAPGVDVLSLRAAYTDMYRDGTRIVDERYYRANGTSMACPHVVGVAALVWSAHPDWTADEVRAQLKHTADDIDGTNPEYAGLLGAGRVNAFKALSMAAPQPNLCVRSLAVLDGSSAHPNGGADPGEAVFVKVTVSNGWIAAANAVARLRSLDPHLDVLAGDVLLGDIPQGGTADNGASPCFVRVADQAPFGSALACVLDVTAENWQGALPCALTVNAPRVTLAALRVEDLAGDGDGFLEPGETANVVVQVLNSEEGAPLAALSARLESSHPDLRITQPHGLLGGLAVGGETDNAAGPFGVSFSGGAAPGARPDLHLVLSAANGYAETFELQLCPPESETVLWQEYIEDPLMELDLVPLTAVPGARSGVHLLWQDMVRFDRRTGYGHWSGGAWLREDDILAARVAIPWEQTLGLDARDRPCAAWIEARDVDEWDYTATVHVARRDGRWSAPSVLNEITDLDKAFVVRTSADGAGRLHAVWMRSLAGRTGVMVHHAVRTAAGWGPPQAVRQLAQDEWPTWGRAVTLARGKGNALVLVWPTMPRQGVYSVRYLEYDGATWSSLHAMPFERGYIAGLDLAVDDAGVRHLALADSGAGTRLYGTSEDGFTVLKTLATGISNGVGPSLDVGPDGAVHVAYSKDAQLFYQTVQHGAPAPARALATLPGYGYLKAVDLVVDADNHVHVFYQTYESPYMNSIRHLVLPGRLPTATATATPSATVGPTVTPSPTPTHNVALELW